MSEREQIQETLTEYLESKNYFDAPYGVIAGIQKMGKGGKGEIREIAFGVSRYLDASIQIWTPKKIVVKGQGGLAYKFEGEFNSCEELIEHFNKEIHE